MAVLRVQLFGGFQLQSDEVSLPVIASRAGRSLLAYLIAHRDQPHTRDRLAGLFWPNRPDAQARRRLSQALWRARQALEPLPDDRPYILNRADSLQFNPQAPCWLDVEAFERRANRAASGPTSHRFSLLQEAVELYAGEFMAGYYDDWILTERERLRERYLETLADLIQLCKSQGHYEEALTYASRLARDDPLQEKAHREVMRLCFLLNQPQEALRQYEHCRALLSDELGIEPGPATATLHQEIRRYLDQQATQPPEVTQPAPATLQGAGVVTLVGRKKERTALVRALERALSGRGGLVIVEGEPGVGKTRLLQQMEEDAAWRGLHVLWGHGREGAELTPYGALREALTEGLSPLRAGQLAERVDRFWLREVSRAVPQLAEWLPDLSTLEETRSPGGTKPAGEGRRLLEGLTRVLTSLARITPHVLILDDLQWVDESTLRALTELSPRLRDVPLLLVVSYRGDEARARPTVWDTLRELDQTGAYQRLLLARLSQAETARLIQRGLGLMQAAPRFEARLYQETGGNPLFLLETLRALRDEGLLYQDEGGIWHTPWDETTTDYAELPLSPELQRVISGRLARLDAATRTILEVAAVFGDAATLALLRQISPLETSSTLNALEELLRRGLLVEETSRYDFSHDTIRQVAYDETPTAKRRIFHRRAATALEATPSQQIDLLARHAFRGQLWDKAVEYNLQAAEQAQRVYAHPTALTHLNRAARILDEHQPFDPQRADEIRYNILAVRQDVYWVRGEKERQKADLDRLHEVALSLNDPQRTAQSHNLQAVFLYSDDRHGAAQAQASAALEIAREHDLTREAALALTYLGDALFQSDQYAEAETALRGALEAWEQVDEVSNKLIGAHARLNQVYRKLGRLDQAQAELKAARTIAESLDDRLWLTIVFTEMGVLASIRGDRQAAVDYQRQGLAHARASGNRRNEAVLLGNIGLDYLALGDLGQAITSMRQGLKRFREMDNRRGVVVSLCDLGELYIDTGRYERAQAALEEGVALAQEIRYPYIEALLWAATGRMHTEKGELESASTPLQRAQETAKVVQAPFVKGKVHHSLGLLRLRADDPSTAASHFRQALDQFQAAGEAGWVTLARSYLALCRWANDERDKATRLSARAISDLESQPGGEQVPVIYFHHWRIMGAAGAQDEAWAALERSHAELQARQATLSDAAWQRAFLEQVPAHREIVAAYEALGAERETGQVRVRLPHADAPTGRPLRDEEWVQVSWTVAAPADEEIGGKKARRQHRLLRLLQEAAAQDAAPTVDDLADVLDVSSATIKRDLAALRAEGHAVTTRGSRAR